MYVKCVCVRINGSILLYYRIMPISDVIGCQTKTTARVWHPFLPVVDQIFLSHLPTVGFETMSHWPRNSCIIWPAIH